jgi:hypothetical protein
MLEVCPVTTGWAAFGEICNLSAILTGKPVGRFNRLLITSNDRAVLKPALAPYT